MTKELAANAGAGGFMLMLIAVVTLMALEGAAGGRSLPPTLVAGLLFFFGLVAVIPGRVGRDLGRASTTGAASGGALPLGHRRHRR
jgi:hypothetical protein